MSFINYYKKEINCKIIYFGTSMGGKTTNVQYIYQKTSPDLKNELTSLNMETEKTLFFDFLPLELPEVQGFKVKFHLYTVPGQTFYEASRKLILRGVDGIIFVADSQLDHLELNQESLTSLEKGLEEQGYDINDIPLVFQWNKRDLPNAVSTQDLSEKLNRWKAPEIEACAIKGNGVFEALKMISKKVLLNVKGGIDESSPALPHA